VFTKKPSCFDYHPIATQAYGLLTMTTLYINQQLQQQNIDQPSIATPPTTYRLPQQRNIDQPL